MASTTAVWSSQASVTMSDTSPADGVKSTGSVNLNTNGYDRIFMQTKLVFPAGASDYVDINIYGSSDGGTTLDSIVLYNRRVDAVASSTVIVGQIVDGIPYAYIEVENQSNVEITTLAVTYQGRTWSTS